MALTGLEPLLQALRGDSALPVPFSFSLTDGPDAARLLAASPATAGDTRTAAGVVSWPLVRPAGGTGIETRCEVRRFERHAAAVEWTLHLRNTTATHSPVLTDIQALDAEFATALPEPVLHYAQGGTCCHDDFRPLVRVLNRGAHVDLQPGGGRSSSQFLPFLNLRLAADRGVIVGIGWSGEWRVRLDHDTPGRVRVRVGQAHTRLRLLPHEEVRTPLVLVLFYTGDAMDGQNALRRLLLDHHRPRAGGAPVEPTAFAGNWGGTSAAVHLANLDALARHDVPYGAYWIDAEWFGHGPWFETVGDWRPKPDLYPAGLRPIADRAHAGSRRFLLWFEPERVCPGTPWYDEHRDWLLELPTNRRAYNWGRSQHEPAWTQWESDRNQIRDGDRLFNLAIPAARQFLTDTIAGAIAEAGIDWYRHDANIAPLAFWQHADPPDRQGITEIRWVEGLYAFWDDLLGRFPHLAIDNCASGGRRIDLEAISRSTPLWRTDFPGSATGRQCHTYGLASWVPLNGTGGANPARDTDYALRSAWSSFWAFGLFVTGDAAQAAPPPADFPFDRICATLRQYRDQQRFFLGDYYPLSEYSQAADAWMAWQFHLPATHEGMIQAFRRERSPHTTALYPLHGLDPARTYEVRDLDGRQPTVRLGGRELTTPGLTLTIPDRPDTAVLTYRAV